MAFIADFQSWTSLAAFEAYLDGVTLFPGCRGVVEHHTQSPDQYQFHGMSSLRNIADYYASTLGWDRGPHLFIAGSTIYQMTPMTVRGIHATSANSWAIGIEHAWNGDKAPFASDLLALSYGVTAALLRKMQLGVTRQTVIAHREVPGTTKTCFGTRMSPDGYRQGLNTFIEQQTFPAIPRNLQDHIVFSRPITGTVSGELGANVRQIYTTAAPIALQLPTNTRMLIDELRPGETWRDSNGWFHIKEVTVGGTTFREPGFIHELLVTTNKS